MTKLKRYTTKERAEKELDRKAKDMVDEHKMTYSEAVSHILSTNSDLAKRYEQERYEPVEVDETPRNARERHYKKVKDAEARLVYQAELLAEQAKIKFKDAYLHVIKNPENEQFVKDSMDR